MKRILTILLLLAMAVQAAGIFYADSSPLCAVQGMDEKNDCESKEVKKESKEYVSRFLLFQQGVSTKPDFNLTTAIILSRVATDHLTPPPDRAFS